MGRGKEAEHGAREPALLSAAGKQGWGRTFLAGPWGTGPQWLSMAARTDPQEPGALPKSSLLTRTHPDLYALSWRPIPRVSTVQSLSLGGRPASAAHSASVSSVQLEGFAGLSLALGRTGVACDHV